MDQVPEIIKDFGQVFCGKKAIEYVKIRNTSKNSQSIFAVPVNGDKILYGRLNVNPKQAVASPGKSVRLTLTYLSHMENLIDVISYNIFDCEKLVARLRVQAWTLGPHIHSKTYNVKFFHLRCVKHTVKHVTLENLNKCDAKFFFDLDEDYKQIQISQTNGVLPAESKLNLKIFFNSPEPGVYYKKIFCLIQYHPPLIINVLCVCQPNSKLEPKHLNLRYPLEICPDNNYMAYMEKLKIENTAEGEKLPFLQKCTAERDCLSGTTLADVGIYSRLLKLRNEFAADNKISLETKLGYRQEIHKKFLLFGWAEDSEMEEEICCLPEEYEVNQINKNKTKKSPIEVFLTTYFVDIKNQAETLRGTTLVNFSKFQRYQYIWDQDPKNIFQIHPDRGIIEPNMKTYFNIYFSPSDVDLLYHTEIDLRVFPCDNEPKDKAHNVVDLPLTQSLRILGNSFPDDSCGWMAQCVVVPKTLQLRSCVPEENVYGTFMIERRGHLPVSFRIIPSKEMNYFVQPPLGYLSRDYQLFVIEFNGKSKEEGVYSENLKIIFNNSESIYETLKVATSVETPNLIIGKNNSYTFTPIFPGARTSETISIKNPTNLILSYEFNTPEDITWFEVVNPKGLIEPNCFSEVTIIFKPEIPCEYEGSLPCCVASISKMDYVKVVKLHLSGSCQYGYLVATPSVYDYGDCLYLEEKQTTIRIFNFSPVLIHFQLIAVHKSFPAGDAQKDVIITPDRGAVPGKCSFEVKVCVIPHDIDTFQYEILCQNLADDSKNTKICEHPRTIFSLQFHSVLPSAKIIDISLEGAGHLFSSHWLWKMMNINSINEGFASLKQESIVEMKFPEAPLDSPSVLITLLIKANKYGNSNFNISKKFNCPCFEESKRQISTDCFHSLVVQIYPSEINIAANDVVKLQFFVSYEVVSPCSFEWTLSLSHQRKLIVTVKSACLPIYEKFSLASTYLNPVFSLKPVCIGDTNPPLQLFWLYNNNNQPAAYGVDKITLGGDNSNVQVIFECINPKGVIPPFSSLPLGFFFRPNELKCYTAQVALSLHETKIEYLLLTGEGIPNIQQNKELGFERTIPKTSNFNNSKVGLHCTINYINIDFHRTFSKIKRIFIIKNRSNTITWSFRWHTFKIDNIAFARIQPSEGRLEPDQKAVMTLVFESYSYPASLSFSIPCDVINYSALKAYEEAVRLQEIMTNKTKDYFTITEKGITFENPVIDIPEKPQLHHIFISVNANIFSNLNVEMKLKSEQQWRLKAKSEMETSLQADVFLKTTVLPSILQIFEKNLWDILTKSEFWKKMESRKSFHDLKYLQLLPEKRRERKKESISGQLQISCLQSLFEKELKEILSSFVCKAE